MMTYDEFFAEAKRLNCRMVSDDPAEVRAALDAKDSRIETQGRQIETLLRGITDARCLMDPIWRERMGAESVREHVQRGLRCIDSAITDCKFLTPN